MRMRTPRTILAAGVALAFLAAPFGARAQGDFEKAVRKCDATIQKEALKFKGDLAKRLGKCMDQTRLEIFKDAKNVAGGSPEKTDFAKRAQKCEDQLDKALGFSNPSGSDSKLAKFLDKIDSTGDCTDQAVLEELGHLIGGDNAPPTGGQPQDWVKVKLAMSKIFGALEWLLKASPTALTTLDTLIARGTDDVTPSASTVIDCTVPSHPNLCTLHKDQPTPLNSYAPGTGSVRNACHLHECELATDDGAPASASHVNFTVATPGSTEIDLFIPVGGSTILKICKVDPIPVLGADLGADFRLLAGAPSRASKAINLLGSAFLCVEGVTAQGWCDCSGGNLIDVDVNVCSDHVTGDGDSCSGTV
jgi:hypothetical protein